VVSCLETRRPERKTSLSISAPPPVDTVSQIRENVTSLFGNEFPPLQAPKRTLIRLRKLIPGYLRTYNDYPDSLETLMDYARGLDAIGNYKLANKVYAEGVSKFNKSAELFQYKGLNEIMSRNFREAVKDLQTAVLLNRGAVKVEDQYQDFRFSQGTRQFYSWYYLGVAYYFNRNYDSAISSFRKCLEMEKKDDLIVMPYYWLYIIFQEIGNPTVAETFLVDITTKMTIDKSKDYYRGLLLFKGMFRPQRLLQFTVDSKDKINSPVQAYALAIWYRLNDQPDEAREIINLSIDSYLWDDIGYIAGEVDSYYAVNNLN